MSLYTHGAMTMGRERLVSTVTEEEEGDIDICSNSDLSDCARWVQCWCSRSAGGKLGKIGRPSMDSQKQGATDVSVHFLFLATTY